MNYIDNKYYRWYTQIVNAAKQRTPIGYTEKHHIQPKSLQGTNDPDNLVRLTAREHFICHRLLVKFTQGTDKRKMYWALHKMMYRSNKDQVRYAPNSRTFALLREEFVNNVCRTQVVSEAQRNRWIEMNKARKGTRLSDAHRKAMSDAHQGRVLTEEHKANISKSLKGKTKSKEHKEKIRQNRLGTTKSDESKRKVSQTLKAKGRKLSDEAKQKLSEQRSNYLANCTTMYVCEHCGVASKLKGNITRWHNDNCKHKPFISPLFRCTV